MRMLLGLIGICLVAFAAGTYFEGLKTGICLSLCSLGVGLFIDAVRK
jgi:hypothetical protein